MTSNETLLGSMQTLSDRLSERHLQNVGFTKSAAGLLKLHLAEVTQKLGMAVERDRAKSREPPLPLVKLPEREAGDMDEEEDGGDHGRY